MSEDHFETLYQTFLDAFSDYVFPFALTETQFRNHIRLNGVDLGQTVGCYYGERLVGFSLNGFGEWEGRSTVYDAGTGVIPAVRRQGVSEAMFEMMMPHFRREGIEQCLLEVISSNAGAIRLYEKLGFAPVRELALMQCDRGVKAAVSRPHDVDVSELGEPEWELLEGFWDGRPSWQNSTDAIRRSSNLKRIFGAFLGGQCVGYTVFSSNFGRVAQIAVDRAYRNRGIGTLLLQKMNEITAPGYSLQVINIDKSLETAVRFFHNRGFYERLSQHEMVSTL